MSSNPYKTPYSSSGKEIDLRRELKRLLYGSSEEVPKGRIGLLRRMRTDSNGDLMRCECRDVLTDEQDMDSYCPHCLGHGYYWTEYPITYFRDDSSFRKIEGYYKEFEGDVFYVEYNVAVQPEDYIITIKLNAEGNAIIPIERDKFFKVLSPDPFRSDNGRIEFWGIRAKEERKWSTFYGVQNRQTI